MLTDVASETLNNIAIMIREQLTHRQAAYVVGQESSSKPNKTQESIQVVTNQHFKGIFK